MGLDNPLHIAFLLVLVMLVFGAKRLPEMGRSLGSGMRGFRDELTGKGSSTPTAGEGATAPALGAAPVLAADPTVAASAALASEPAVIRERA